MANRNAQKLWCFTIFQNLDTAEKDFQQWIDDKDANGVAYGMETCPKTGKKHYQCFVQWRLMHNLKWCRTKRNCHWEACKGTIEDNEKYCSKEEQYTVLGNLSISGLGVCK